MTPVAGTDTGDQNPRTDPRETPRGVNAQTRGLSPVVVLVEPQLGENIGMCARAMLNGGLTELRLVNPRDGWPNEAAIKAASGADVVLDNARVFETLDDAIADLSRVLATTARLRDATYRELTPRQAGAELTEIAAAGQRAGVLFGREAKGLRNDEISRCDAIITAPLNPTFSSLNIAQAVLMLAYEWWQAGPGKPGFDTPDHVRMPTDTRPANRAEMMGLFNHLESELDDCGFLRVVEKRPTMVANIRSMFNRANLTEQEVRTLRGIITGLTKHAGRGKL